MGSHLRHFRSNRRGQQQQRKWNLEFWAIPDMCHTAMSPNRQSLSLSLTLCEFRCSEIERGRRGSESRIMKLQIENNDFFRISRGQHLSFGGRRRKRNYLSLSLCVCVFGVRPFWQWQIDTRFMGGVEAVKLRDRSKKSVSSDYEKRQESL